MKDQYQYIIAAGLVLLAWKMWKGTPSATGAAAASSAAIPAAWDLGSANTMLMAGDPFLTQLGAV